MSRARWPSFSPRAATAASIDCSRLASCSTAPGRDQRLDLARLRAIWAAISERSVYMLTL